MKKIYKTIMPGGTFFAGLKAPIRMGAIIMELENGTKIICDDFRTYKGKLSVLIFLPAQGKWVRTRIWNDDALTMLQFRKKSYHGRNRSGTNYKGLMKHDRRRKTGSGGGRIVSANAVTEYECSKTPLHDFPRSRYVQWN